MPDLTLIATSAFGLEAVVARELQQLGYQNTRTQQGQVHFQGDLQDICRANLWLRAADRVLWKLHEFDAATFDELYDAVRAMPWEAWIPKEFAFPVIGKSVKSALHSVPACQSIIKKAIVDRLGHAYGVRQLPETGAKMTVQFALLKDHCVVSFDTTGAGLHKRGYRTLVAEAPLKETLAAALVLLSRWTPDRMFLDPFCGSGTLPIEAALIGLNRAPGRHRLFDASVWPLIPMAAWQAAWEEADSLASPNRKLRIYGSDVDGEVLKLARHHIEQAGLTGKVFVEKKGVAEIRSKLKYGVIVTNPPYGERLGDAENARKLYATLGARCQELEGWGCYVLSPEPLFEKAFGRWADRKRKLYNGPLRCDLYQYWAAPLPKKPGQILDNA